MLGTRPSLTMPKKLRKSDPARDKKAPLEIKERAERKFQEALKRIQSHPDYVPGQKIYIPLEEKFQNPERLYKRVKEYQRKHPDAQWRTVWKEVDNPYSTPEALYHTVQRIDFKQKGKS